MIYKWRKKYTPEVARQEIQICEMSIQGCQECILTFTLKEDPLIQALVWKTREEIIKENQERIEYDFSKIEYMKKFVI